MADVALTDTNATADLAARAESTRRAGAVALAAFTYQTVWVVGCTFLIWLVLMLCHGLALTERRRAEALLGLRG